MAEPRRLHWGCGSSPAPCWVNSDRRDDPEIDLVADIREGLPAADGSFDYAFSMHALQELPLDDAVPALCELRRVLRPGGVLRLCLPDLDRGIDAYRRGDTGHFLVPDWESPGAKFVVHMLWYGHSRLLFTRDFVEELLRRAGFARVDHVAFGETASPYPEIVELDARPEESLFVEATR